MIRPFYVLTSTLAVQGPPPLLLLILNIFGLPTKHSSIQVDAAMRAHADGKQPDLSSASSPSNADRTSQSPSLKTVRGAESSAAVKKGFLSAGGGGTLYGDEGSREGDSLKGRRNQHDQAFERLVVEADPDMGSAQVSSSRTLPCAGTI